MDDNIIKQGILRKGTPDGRPVSGIFGKLDPGKYSVLLVRGGQPFLEIYDKEEDLFRSRPQQSLNLSECKKVTYTLSCRTRTFSFCIILTTKVHLLMVNTREQLLSWVSAIEECLHKLGILQKTNDEHVYSFCPAVVNVRGNLDDEKEKDSVDGAVGGIDSHDESIYTITDDHPPTLDEEDIFGSFGDTTLRRKSWESKLESKDSSQSFEFDWMKKPTSLPVVQESERVSVTESEDVSGSSDFVDLVVFDKNKIFKTAVSSAEKKKDSTNSDTDGEYCAVDGSATLNNYSAQGAEGGGNANSVDISKGKSEILTVDLPSAASCAGSDCKPDKKKEKENDYAPFPVQPTMPNLINFDEYGTAPLETSSDVKSSAFRHSVGQATSLQRPKSPTELSSNILRKTTNQSKLSNLSNNHSLSTRVNHNSVCDPSSTKTLNHSGLNDNDRNQSHYLDLSGRKAISDLQPDKLINENFVYEPMTRDSSNETLPNSGSSNVHQLPAPPPIPTPVPRPRTKKRMSAVHNNAKPEDVYEGIFDDKVTVDSLAPMVPPRTDSLVLFNTATQQTGLKPNVLSPSLDPEFKFNLSSNSPSIPPLPPRNIVKSQSVKHKKSEDAPPPIPARQKQHQRQLSFPPSGDVFETTNNPRRQLSNRMRLDRSQSVHTVISLKQNQIDILKEEMLLPNTTVTIQKRWFSGLALIDSFNSVWVAGWNVVDFPRLHDKFHIGDKIISINQVPASTATAYTKQIKQSELPAVEIQLKRLPKASVFVIRRSADGESLGIKREGGTAEIVYVDSNGLAGRHNLPQKTKTVHGDNLCNWIITEINSRTLNLYFKDKEIEHRLSAVGRDISLVVQPSDFILDLKKNLKKLKNYKSYLIK